MPNSYSYMRVGGIQRGVLGNGFGIAYLAWQPHCLHDLRINPGEQSALDVLLARIREQGWHHASDLGQRFLAPVWLGPDELAGVIGISTMPRELSKSEQRKLREAVLAAARQAEAALQDGTPASGL